MPPYLRVSTHKHIDSGQHTQSRQLLVQISSALAIRCTFAFQRDLPIQWTCSMFRLVRRLQDGTQPAEESSGPRRRTTRPGGGQDTRAGVSPLHLQKLSKPALSLQFEVKACSTTSKGQSPPAIVMAVACWQRLQGSLLLLLHSALCTAARVHCNKLQKLGSVAPLGHRSGHLLQPCIGY